jgi:hypothetical protein
VWVDAHWLPAAHAYCVPALQVPFAPFAPQPPHVLVTLLVAVPHRSAQAPAVVEQPETALHAVAQHPAAVQDVGVEVQAQEALQAPPAAHVLLHDPAGKSFQVVLPVHESAAQPVVPQYPLPGSVPAALFCHTVWLVAATQYWHLFVGYVAPFAYQVLEM